MNKSTISYGNNLKELIADGNYLSRDDQRFPYLGVAYIEWEGGPPKRSSVRFSLSCHECDGTMIYEPSSEFTGFWGSYETCPSCGVKIEVCCFRAWERGFRPGLFVIAMPYTSTKGVRPRPIKLRILGIRPSESE